jgi:hypothetical protein
MKNSYARFFYAKVVTILHLAQKLDSLINRTLISTSKLKDLRDKLSKKDLRDSVSP